MGPLFQGRFRAELTDTEGWVAEVNRPMDEAALKAVQLSAGHGVPLGTDNWKAKIAARLGLGTTLRPRGRPRKRGDEGEKSS